MRAILFYTILSCAFICSCSSDDEGYLSDSVEITSDLSLVDGSATEQTQALYANLWKIQFEGTLFGHHDDLLYGRNWLKEPGNSDIRNVVGDYPGVYSLDFAEIMDPQSALDDLQLNDARRSTIIEAYDRGQVIIANSHVNNPLTGGDAWDNSNSNTVSEILKTGTTTNKTFKSWLDNLASFANSLKGSDGKLIPIIFRPFHEHTQGWSWWGTNTTSEQDFIDLWRFTVGYLRDEKQVHNFIYAISPQIDQLGSRDNILFRWPGDDYVDFIGMDSYHGTSTSSYSSNLRNLSRVSIEKGKPCGVTETGIEGILNGNGENYDSYWTNEIGEPLAGKNISMVVLWRNEYDPNNQGNHFYAPFEGHSSTANFQEFYKNPLILFNSDLPDMYSMPSDINF